MKPILHRYQENALDFCMDRLYKRDCAGAGLFMDPGLGKTLITLTLVDILRSLGEVDSALVVAPLRVCRLVWRQEIDKWGFGLSHNLLCQRVPARLRLPCANIELINPESLHKVLDSCHRWDMLVVDESTKFKNWTSKRMRLLRKILKNFRKRLILTGTPAPNSLADLHAQAFILDNGAALGRNVTVFRSLYMDTGGWMGRQWKVREGQEKNIHRAIAPLCLRLDAETCLDMPELKIHDVECELPASCIPMYRQLKKDLIAQLETGNILAQNAASAYMKMRQFANGRMYDEVRKVHHIHNAKVEALDELVDELAGKPALVFYQFGHDADAIRTKFPKAPVLNGKTKNKDAEKMLNDWNRGKTRVFAVQNQAASHGLNMQGAGNDVIYYGMGDSLEVYEQSYRRIYRQGVKGRQVRIHRLLTRGTVDGIIKERISDKDQTQQEFLEHLKHHARAPL